MEAIRHFTNYHTATHTLITGMCSRRESAEAMRDRHNLVQEGREDFLVEVVAVLRSLGTARFS